MTNLKDMAQTFVEGMKPIIGTGLMVGKRAKVGRPTDNQVPVTDGNFPPGKQVYIHFVTEGGDVTSVAEALIGDKKISELTYERPVIVNKNDDGFYYIERVEPAEDAIYSEGSEELDDQSPVYNRQLIEQCTIHPIAGVLQVQVSSGLLGEYYFSGQASGVFSTGTVQDTSAANITAPTTNGKAKGILIQIDAATETIEYKQSSEFSGILSLQQAYKASLLPSVDTGKRLRGYLKWSKGATQFTTADIWNAIDAGGGSGSSILDNLTATAAPTANDDSGDGYSVGSHWYDVTNDKVYICIDATLTAAEWREVSPPVTASNVGAAGAGVFKQKTGVDLEFKNIVAQSNKIAVVDNTMNDTIAINVTEANLTLTNLGGTLSVAKGGTGATDAATALSNLGGIGAATTDTLTNKTMDADVNTVSNIGAAEVKADLISGATEITSVDTANDFLHIWDATDSALKKVKPQYIASPYVADGIAFTDPTAPTWTALNQGSGTYTEDTTNKRLVILEDGNGSAQLRGWYTSAPSAPYAIRMHCKYWGSGASNMLAVGFRQNSTSELHVIIFGQSTGLQFAVQKWNTATSVNSNYIAATTVIRMPHWYKIEDDNTNRIISISDDGVIWTPIHTIGRTDFLTADEIFFGMIVTTNATYDSHVSLLSYEEL